MALDNLSNLISEMKEWAGDRPDLIPRFKDCIDMTTNDLNKVLRTRKQQETVVVTCDGNGVVALPDDYLEWREVSALTNPLTHLEPLTPEGMTDIYPQPYGGWPMHFCVEEGQLTVLPVTETEIQFKYWKKIPHLTETDDSNWVLADNANVYLFGALKYVEVFKRSESGAQMFGGLYSGLMDGMMRESKHAQWSRTRARVAGRSTP